jgi:hypothetical protein
MKLRAAIALVALAAAPVLAQRGGGHSGSIGGRGSVGHAGFSAPSGFSRPIVSHSGNFERPAMQVPYRGQSGAGFERMRPPGYSSIRTPYYGNGFVAGRPEDRAMGATAARGWDRNGDRDRTRWDARRRSFDQWYASTYPAWLGYGYPYVIDPGFYDWSEPDDSAYDQENAAPYPDYGYGAPGEPQDDGYQGPLPPWPSAQTEPMASTEPAPEQPLTVIFKGGDRAPVKIQNYIMAGGVLTDLDAGHYARIPLDQIDVAETQRINSAAGVEFEIPGAARD